MSKKQSQRQVVDAAVQQRAETIRREAIAMATRPERVYFRGALVRRKP